MRILIGSIASAALLAQAQVSPDARDLLMRSGGAAATANTVRMQGTESSELVYGATSRENSGSFSLAVSGVRTRLETKFAETSPGSAETSELSIVDGASRWRYNRAANVYWQYPAPAGPTNDVLGRIRFSRDPAGFRDGKILRQETMEFGGLQTPCFVVHAAYSKLPGNATAIDVERTVWIAKSNYLVLRDVWEFTMDAAASLPHCFSVRSIRMPSRCQPLSRAVIAAAPPPMRYKVSTAVLSLFATIRNNSSSRGKRRCRGHRCPTSLLLRVTSCLTTSISAPRESLPSSTSASMCMAAGNLHTLAKGKRSSPCMLTCRPEPRCKAAAPTVPSVSAAICRQRAASVFAGAADKPAPNK